jgi:cytochrome c-type biogenesis protein CcmH/NrfG
MKLRRHHLPWIAMMAVVFAASFALFAAINEAEDAPAAPRPNADSHVLSAQRLLQRVRDTEDPSLYAPAEKALAEAHRLEPNSPAVALGHGELAMSKHHFRDGLRWGLRAQRLAPDTVRPLGLIADAQLELGRYEQAERTLQRMVDLKPGLPAYSRISYFRELHGDVEGATEAMRLAVSAAGSKPSEVAGVRVLLGQLELARGRTADGERIFRSVLDIEPRNPKALDGLADVEIAKGRPRAALARWRTLSAAVPSPHYATDVVELSLAFGLRPGAERAIARVRALDGRLVAAGADIDTESAVFEADHGSPRRALAMARRAYRDAPAVQRADALGWALTRNGRPSEGIRLAREAMRLGTGEPMFLFHGAIAAKEAGRDALARRWLSRLLRESPGFSPLHEPRAKMALRDLR